MATATASSQKSNPVRIEKTSWLSAPGHAGSLAVIAGGRVYVCRNQDPQRATPRPFSHRLSGHDLTSLAPVAKWALESNVENVWILPGAGRFAEDFRALVSVSAMQEDAGGEYVFHELTSRKLGMAQLAGVVAQRARGGALCTIWSPKALPVWGLSAALGRLLEGAEGSAARATNLMHAWLLASYALGLRLRFGPSYSGISHMRNVLAESRRAAFAQPSARYQEIIARAEASPLAWIAPAREVERPDELVKVWTYDRNWSYVSSARVVPLGDPTPVGEFVANRPGMYRINATPPATWRANQPDPFQRGKLHDIWAWEPQMRNADAFGWSIELLEGYAWIAPNSTHDLRPWQERMWKARNDLAHRLSVLGAPGAAAKAIVSNVGRAAIGRLKHDYGRKLVESASEDDEVLSLEIGPNGLPTGMVEIQTQSGRSDMERPEWYSTIVALASERPLAMSYAHARYDSLALNVDSLSAPSPRGLEGPTDKPGGWRLEYAGVEILAGIAHGGDLQAFNRAVKRAAREQGQP